MDKKKDQKIQEIKKAILLLQKLSDMVGEGASLIFKKG